MPMIKMRKRESSAAGGEYILRDLGELAGLVETSPTDYPVVADVRTFDEIDMSAEHSFSQEFVEFLKSPGVAGLEIDTLLEPECVKPGVAKI